MRFPGENIPRGLFPVPKHFGTLSRSLFIQTGRFIWQNRWFSPCFQGKTTLESDFVSQANETVEKVPKWHILFPTVKNIVVCLQTAQRGRKSPEKKAELEQKNLDTIPGLCYDTGEFRAEHPSAVHDVKQNIAGVTASHHEAEVKTPATTDGPLQTV